jgi:hypothetical protein
MIALAALEGGMWAVISNISDLRSRILEDTKYLYDRSLHEMQWYTTMYSHDHRKLGLQYRAYPEGTLLSLSKLYASLYDSGGVMFKAQSSMDAKPSRAETSVFIRGRERVSSADFPGDYRKRAAALASYGRGVIKGNIMDLDMTLGYAGAIASMDAAPTVHLTLDVLGGDKKSLWKFEHEKILGKAKGGRLYYNAADPGNFNEFAWSDKKKYETPMVSDDIITGPGYRWSIQATAQAGNLKNFVMPAIRVGVLRQAEAEAKFAMNERSERADSHYAFGGAVGSWTAAKEQDGF